MRKLYLVTLALTLSHFCNEVVYAQVTEEWVARYNGPANGDDGASSIVVDESGNVYVTGSSRTSDITFKTFNYVTIKYNSDGAVQWVQRYIGPGNNDNASSIAIDGSGNVYVTGSSFVSGFSDYATIKYNSDGVQQWVQRYNGPGNSHDDATSIAVDGLGNVYVTGVSKGIGTNDDYATIKYNSDGVELWVQRYNGPQNFIDQAISIAVDGLGNVYVTGSSSGSGIANDYATIKYNSDGVELWVQRYNGPPGNGWDWATSITVDGLGNVYVTGSSNGGGTNNDYATIKYDSDGVEQWVQRYNGPPGNGWDWATSITVDGLGNVYVTGSSDGVGTNSDYATIKYDSDGAELWVQRYNGPVNADDRATSIAVDGLGNVFVTGYGRGSATNNDDDYATIKYNSAGVEQWVQRYNGPGNNWDYTGSMAIDGSGNVYVTGGSTGIGTGLDYATIKYSQEPIPVELISFSAMIHSGKVILNWSTATELNNLGFEIERSTNNNNWRIIGFKEGNGTTTETQNYSFVDKLYYISSEKLYYRLKQIDYDGSFEYSPVVEVEVTEPMKFALNQNYPNPFNPSTRIVYSIPNESKVSLKVLDILGREVAELVNEVKTMGRYEVEFGNNQLASGVYFYRLQAVPLGRQAENYIETRKMILLR